MNNTEIRARAKSCGVKLWEIAECMGIADHTFSRKLRKELPEEEKSRILSIIDKLSNQK